MLRSLAAAIVAAVLSVALGGAGATAPSGQGEGLIDVGGVISQPALLPLLRPAASLSREAPPAAYLPGVPALPSLAAAGPLRAPPFPSAFASPTCPGARASRGPPAPRS